MNALKKTMAMILALAATLTLAACGGEEPTTEDQLSHSYNDTWQEETHHEDQPQAEEQEVAASAKYETAELIPYGASVQAKDIFKSFADDEQKLFYTTDGRLMHIDDMSTDFWFGGQDVQSTCVVYGSPAYTDSKGYTHIRINNKEYPIKEIKGEIFWAFVGMLNGELNVCSRDADGSLYLNAFSKTGVKSCDNEKLYFYDINTKAYFDRADRVRFVNDSMQPNAYVEIDGVAYYYNVTGIYNFSQKRQIWISSSNTWNTEDVLDYGYGGAESPLYRKTGDNTAVYYLYGFSNTELPIFMPQGKTVDQLTKVIFSDITYLFFADGSVFSGTLTDDIVGPTLTQDATLTRLNTDGVIRDVYRSTYWSARNCQLRLLLDDNVTYTYQPSVQ